MNIPHTSLSDIESDLENASTEYVFMKEWNPLLLAIYYGHLNIV
jgi:hypothetical protein